MQLAQSRALAARLEWLPRATSTNDVLKEAAAGAEAAAWPDFSVVATDEQTAGRGRLDRVWTAPAGTSLAVSVLLRPRLPLAAMGWLPLLAGTAMTRALRALDAPAVLKWPNDVLVRDRKVCGVLTELVTGGGVVVGAGVNLTVGPEDLPVPTATSLAVEGVAADVDTVLSGYLRGLRGLVGALVAAGGDAESSGLRAEVELDCGTIGRAVRVELPGASTLVGTAVGLDPDGRLLVAPAGSDATADGVPSLQPVAAGDVTHLRY